MVKGMDLVVWKEVSGVGGLMGTRGFPHGGWLNLCVFWTGVD